MTHITHCYGQELHSDWHGHLTDLPQMHVKRDLLEEKSIPLQTLWIGKRTIRRGKWQIKLQNKLSIVPGAVSSRKLVYLNFFIVESSPSIF